MGDNASANWAWHNTIVGQGYQAKGVVRQREATTVKVIDFTSAASSEPSYPPDASTDLQVKEKDRKKTKKERKESHTSEDDQHHSKRIKKAEKTSKEKREKKNHKKHSHSTLKDKRVIDTSIDEFNPLLQYLATSLSNKTRKFTLEND